MMKKPLDKRYRDLTVLCLAGLLLALAGCGESGGGPSGPPGAHPMMGPPGAPRAGGAGPMASGGPPGVGPNVATSPKLARPGLNPLPATPAPDKDKGEANPEGDKKDGNPLASVIKVEEAGNLVSLASEIIAAGVNPFLSRLPRPLQPQPTTGEEANPASTTEGQAPPPPPSDPLEGINLLGVVYNPKAPMALISVPNGRYASQVVRTGDVITLDQGNAKVGKITQQSIEIHMLDQQKKRTVMLPDIVGYTRTQGSSGSAPASSSEGPAGGSLDDPLGGMFGVPSPQAVKPASKPAPQAGGPMGGPTTMPGSPMGMGGFSNLKRLASGVTGSSATSPGANVVLKEP